VPALLEPFPALLSVMAASTGTRGQRLGRDLGLLPGRALLRGRRPVELGAPAGAAD
jgi:hypothetical protein